MEDLQNIDSKKKVSILIPFKNTDMFIFECLDSIINQSYKNWEALFIDDQQLEKKFGTWLYKQHLFVKTKL